ncbi:hypothetical protein JYQ62_35110 [Nostoc sp. UHCC 0702]|nr:hypothetical protein JYQ62_35110 [Nostoc sp. UHCC 0702]
MNNFKISDFQSTSNELCEALDDEQLDNIIGGTTSDVVGEVENTYDNIGLFFVALGVTSRELREGLGRIVFGS